MRLFKKNANVNGAAGPATVVPPQPQKSPMLANHSVPMPKWHFGLRVLQLLLAILILGLVGYAEHVYHGTGLRSAYILAIVVAVLTILLFIPLSLLHQIRPYHPGAAFLWDLLPMLLWLATLAVLASYSHVYKPDKNIILSFFDSDPVGSYRGGLDAIAKRQLFSGESYYRKLKKAWACGAAAAAFAGFEFILFLLTSFLFLRYFHRHHLSSSAPPTYAVEHNAGTNTSFPHATTDGLDGQHDSSNNGVVTAGQYEMQQRQPNPHSHDENVIPVVPVDHARGNVENHAVPDIKTVQE